MFITGEFASLDVTALCYPHHSLEYISDLYTIKICQMYPPTEFDISVSKLLGFETFLFFLMVSVSVSENFGIEKSIGIGFGKIWYRKKYRYRFRKILVSKKVSVLKNLILVSKNFGIKKSISF